MELKLKNPLIFFDLETTGLNILKDRIVEISYIKVHPNGREESDTLRINPEMHIPEATTALHHITDDDVRDCPTFKQVAHRLEEVFRGCDIAGFASNRFDIPLLDEEFARAGIEMNFMRRKFVDVQTIFHKMEPRNLAAAYRLYCGKDLTDAHTANADTRATYEVLKAQLDRYPTLQNDVEQLAQFSKQSRNVDYVGRIVLNDNDVEVFNFGKYKGEPVEAVFRREPGYCDWIMKGDFPNNTKKVVWEIYLRSRQK